MPLYMPERISDLEIQQNPYATFVYFDTVKGDCFVQDNLHVKSAATNANLICIVFAKDMSPDGFWSKEEFNSTGKTTISESFVKIRRQRQVNKLVVFPMVPFSLAKSTAPEWVQDYMDKCYIEMVNSGFTHAI